jgi:enamine deaminase RidA (YjgF/YER057c/UK114 family)
MGSGYGAVAIIPASWADFYDATHIPAATRSGDTIRLTGHTGERPDHTFPPDSAEQIRQTFANIAETLAEAGATWADVVEINAFHLDLPGQSDDVLKVAGEFLSEPYPAWTAMGVTQLFESEAVVEISCVAVIGNAASNSAH